MFMLNLALFCWEVSEANGIFNWAPPIQKSNIFLNKKPKVVCWKYNCPFPYFNPCCFGGTTTLSIKVRKCRTQHNDTQYRHYAACVKMILFHRVMIECRSLVASKEMASLSGECLRSMLCETRLWELSFLLNRCELVWTSYKCVFSLFCSCEKCNKSELVSTLQL